MDPLSAVSLAGTVVGLVDFLIKLASNGYKLYNDRNIDELDRIRTAADDLTNYTARLKPALEVAGQASSSQALQGDFTEEEYKVIRRVCDESDAVKAKLMELLKELEPRKGNWKEKKNGKAARAAEIARLGFMAAWNKGDIEHLQGRLSALRESVDSTILRAMSRRLLDIKLDTSAIFDRLDQQTRQITESLLQSQRYIVTDSQSRTVALTQLLNRCEGYVSVSRFRDESNMVAAEADPAQAQETAVRREVTKEVLASLLFPSIAERREQVSDAHKETFQWIFRRPFEIENHDMGRWDDFVAWLEEGDGLYWIAGKAGSGKSTLMKYIVSHPATDHCLKQWSSGCRILKGAFFFWGNGTREQNSQVGLLKSLLYEILTKVPELVPVVFPSEWSKRYTMKLQSSWSFPSIDTWSLSQLELAFQILLEQQHMFEPLKICLFIDGLDEFDGDDGRIADLVIEVAKSKNVKLCVSSRPHVVFTDTFAELPRLRLQDLTHPDIVAYVSDVLLNDRRMERLVDSNPEQAQSLADRVVTGASGVFLWVTLVVSSLLRGLGNRDNMHILHQRLDELPTDLSQLFHHMIQKVERVYQSEASRLFQLVAMVSDHSDSRPFAMLPLTVLGAHLALGGAAAPMLHGMDTHRVLDICEEMSATVTTHSGGLLEVQSGNSADVTPYMTISYIHQTVSEFMRQNGVHSLFAGSTGGTKSPTSTSSVALLRSAVLILDIIKGSPQPPCAQDHEVWCINAVACAIQADRDAAEAPPVDLLDHLYATLERQCFLEVIFRHGRDGVSWLAFAARLGLQHYLEAKLQLLVETDDVQKRHLNVALWFATDIAKPFNDFVSPPVVHTLLEHGADPNCKGMASLTHFLTGLKEYHGLRRDLEHLTEPAEIINDLLDHGARPGRSTDLRHRGVVTDCEVVRNVFPGLKFEHLRRRVDLAQKLATTQQDSGSVRNLPSDGLPGSVLLASEVASLPPSAGRQKTASRGCKRWRQFWCFR